MSHWAIAGIVAVSLYFVLQNLHRIRDQHHLSDFRTFYAAAQAMDEGRSPYHTDTPRAYVYPPMLAFLYLPLTRLSDVHATMVCLVVNYALMLVAMISTTAAMVRRLGPTLPRRAILFITGCAALATIGQIKAEVQMLQTDVLVLLGFALALCWIDRAPGLAGMALAFAFNIKYLTLACVPYLIVRRRWGALTSFILCAAGFALLPAFRVGLQADLQYVKVAFRGLGNLVDASPGTGDKADVHHVRDDLSVSITSGVARSLPLALDAYALPLAALIGVVAFIATAACYRARKIPFLFWPAAQDQVMNPFFGLVGIEWAGLVLLSLAFSPDTNVRHLILAFVGNAAAVTLICNDTSSGVTSRRGRWVLIAAIAAEVVVFDLTEWFGRVINRQSFLLGAHGWTLLFLFGAITVVGLRRLQRDAASDVRL